MKVDWSENPDHLAALQLAVGVEFFKPVHWLSIVDDADRLVVVFAFHAFSIGGCELSVASFRRATVHPRLLAEVFAYPFYQLSLRRMTAIIAADNPASLQTAKRLGFRVEGLLRQWYPQADGICHGMLKEECKWLRRR